MSLTLTPIGHIKSMFHQKNGTPRQSGLIKSARASLTINKAVFNNPEHSLEDLSSFSHVWLIWVFHANGGVAVKAKVAPPRLKGKRVGVFSSRSPHRPCPLGLTLAKVERVEGATVHLSGIDLIDGTPVLDVKPYIPQYDSVQEPYIPQCDSVSEDKELYIPQCDSVIENKEPCLPQCDSFSGENDSRVPQYDSVSEDRFDSVSEKMQSLFPECGSVGKNAEPSNSVGDNIKAKCDSVSEDMNSGKEEAKIDSGCDDLVNEDVAKSDTNTSDDVGDSIKVKVPEWVGDQKDDLAVCFTERSLKDIDTVDESKLNWLESRCQLQVAITEILTQDPRSVYRRDQCSDRLYFTDVDTVHVTAWFDDRINTVEVLRVKLKNVQSH